MRRLVESPNRGLEPRFGTRFNLTLKTQVNRVCPGYAAPIAAIRISAPSRAKSSTGIIGLFHILPPALAWLWRLVAPRGHDNPSITDTEGMSSEGVGSYWPFATGKLVTQANLLQKQIQDHPHTRVILVPNQHSGIYKVSFMPQWIAREYLARRGSARFSAQQMTASRSPLLGYALNSVKVGSVFISKELLEVNKQEEVGDEGYDAGALILSNFFKKELKKFLNPELDPQGRKIIECAMRDDSLEDYLELLPMKL